MKGVAISETMIVGDDGKYYKFSFEEMRSQRKKPFRELLKFKKKAWDSHLLKFFQLVLQTGVCHL